MESRSVLGWEEWLALPDLDLPAIKAKVDTGAKTSALHAFVIEPVGSPMRPMVRFGVHPIPGRSDVAVYATAEVVDHREVTSSNGERELRYVIRTRARMNGREWPIELTLANRESMSYRMLLGRQAIQDDMVVDPSLSFVQPRLSYRVYPMPSRPREDRRKLRICLLTRRPENATNRRLQRAAETRGHTLRIVDRARVSLFIDPGDAAVMIDGVRLHDCDALIVRPGRGTPTFSAAIARQLDMLGTVVLGSADAFIRASDPIAVRQCLAHAGIPVPAAAVTHGQAVRADDPDRHVLADSLTRGMGPLVRVIVVGGRAVAAITQEPGREGAIDEPPWQALPDGATTTPLKRLAERASRVLQLEVAGVEMVMTPQGPLVTEVTITPRISQVERLTGAAVCEAIIIYIEQITRTVRDRWASEDAG